VFEYLTRRLKYFLILILSELFYIGGLSRSVYSGDAGDLVSAAVTCGIPHPPGYPLYTFFGCILTRFNLLTPAYRVGLLSAIPAGISLLVIFVILEKITKNFWISVISICTLSFTYLFWLYSIVPEVFGLNTLFITLLIYISLLILDKPTKRRFYALALVFGLSLSHHHTILFLSPALLYIIYKSRKALRTYGHNFYIIFPALFFLGLIPYTYLPIAAWGNPKINWNDPRNLNNFVALVTRADYGTFTSANVIGETLLERSASLVSFFQILFLDFGLLGIVLIILGAIDQFRTKIKIFYFNFLAIVFLGPIFLFYASFPLVSNFGVGTFERFLIPTYPFLLLWMGTGMYFISKILTFPLKKILNTSEDNFYVSLASFKNLKISFLTLTSLLFMVFPYKLFISNYPKLSILKNDFTAENLGKDILATIPEKGILLIGHDIPLFNTQYVYFSLGERKDVKLIHFGKLSKEYYVRQLNLFYPEISAPKFQTGNYAQKLVEANYGKFPIYSNIKLSGIKDGFWIPYGLVYRFYKKDDLPKDKNYVLEETEKVWKSYHDPLSGSLKYYHNLMQVTIPEQYSEGRLENGKSLVKLGFLDEAKKYFLDGIRLAPENYLNYFYLGETYLLQDKCHDAEKFLLQSYDLGRKDSAILPLMISLYKDCKKDDKKVKFYQEIYEKTKKERSIPLEKLE